MGTVYEARHRTGKRVAIKVLRPELCLSDEVVRRFFREGYLANSVDHPGAVSVLDDGRTSEGLPFMVMEYLEGEDIDSRTERLGRGLALPDALAIGVAVLDVLEAAHAKGIIHRDIKPENVFLTADGRVKLLDFGIASLLDSPGAMNLTRAGSTVGTPTFMPREQALGQREQVDRQSDLWSLGATIFFAISTDFLYPVSSVSGFLACLVTTPPRRMREVAPSVPAPIAAVIDRALQHDKSLRWASASEMKQALLDAAREAGVTIPRGPSLAGYVSREPSRVSLPSLPEELSTRMSAIPGPRKIAASTVPAGPLSEGLSAPGNVADSSSAPPVSAQRPSRRRGARSPWQRVVTLGGVLGLAVLTGVVVVVVFVRLTNLQIATPIIGYAPLAAGPAGSAGERATRVSPSASGAMRPAPRPEVRSSAAASASAPPVDRGDLGGSRY